jgi:hypothetical protein
MKALVDIAGIPPYISAAFGSDSLPVCLPVCPSSRRKRVIERDYIMRMIAMLTAVITKIMGFKAQREYPQGLLELEKACKSLLGVDADILEAFTEDQLVELLARDRELAPSRWYILGVLLQERSELLRLSGRGGSDIGLELKSLRLLLESFLDPDATPAPDHRQRLGQVIGLTRGQDLPRRTSECLARYFESLGEFAKAEDIHLDLLDQDPGHGPEVRRFYERLLARSDQDLMDGNLPRSEVREGLERL